MAADQPRDFLDAYLQYTLDTEATATFHRWSVIVGVGAWLERNIWIQHGANKFFPNHYTMLLGESGSRKSAAIKGFIKILRLAGYKTIAAEKTSKEKFLQDLAAQHSQDPEGLGDETVDILFGPELSENSITPMLIAADEANDFFGINNLEFLSILGSLWDKNDVYENRLKGSKSDFIPNPTISILSGNTPSNFAKAFPSDIIGQGFFSRILLIHGERTRPKIAWPTPPSPESTAAIVTMLQQMREVMKGELLISPEAKELTTHLYETMEPGEDHRFDSYHNRKFTHLLKLCLVLCACKMQMVLDIDTVIQANTYLTYIERLMPKALGQYGKVQNSDVTNKVLEIVDRSPYPILLKDIWKQVDRDCGSMKELGEIMQKLMFADRVQSIPGQGFLPVRKMIEDSDLDGDNPFVDFKKWLTPEELGVKI